MIQIGLAFLGNRWGQMILVAVAAYFYGFWSVPRIDIDAFKTAVIQARDAHWQSKLAEQERLANAELAAAIEARDAALLVPVADADLDRLCKQSATCRDNRRPK